jgi:hypothetical protein
MKRSFVLPATLLAFAAACGSDRAPTGLVGSAGVPSPSGAPNFHAGSGNGSGNHVDLQPASITAPTAGQVFELATVGGTAPVTISWTAPANVPTSVNAFTGYEVILKGACSTGEDVCDLAKSDVGTSTT